jgi:DNA-binding transcriptional MerR regulator
MSPKEEHKPEQMAGKAAAGRSPCVFCGEIPPKGKECPKIYCAVRRRLGPTLRDVAFLSKKAGSFVGVPQRNVQFWTEQGLLHPDIADTTGTGIRRRYSGLNVIELGIIKSLASEGLLLKTIKGVMGGLRIHRELIFDEEATYLSVGISDDSPEEVQVQVHPRLGSWRYAMEQVHPEKYDKILLINLTRIRDRVLKAVMG